MWGARPRQTGYRSFFDGCYRQKRRTHSNVHARSHEQCACMPANAIRLPRSRGNGRSTGCGADEFSWRLAMRCCWRACSNACCRRRGAGTSSNTQQRSVQDGLQRARFMPRSLVEQHCASCTGRPTVRLAALPFTPCTAPRGGSGPWLGARWAEIARRAAEDGSLNTTAATFRGGLAEARLFEAHAGRGRARGDTQIAREPHTVLSAHTQLDAQHDDAARRFVTLIDELYDRHVNLVCTAAAAPAELYLGERLRAAFERTASRLVEMQSAEYLALEHRG